MLAPNFRKVRWWLQDEDKQNFGDYLGFVLGQAIFIRPVREHCSYRIIGSAIADWDISLDLKHSDIRPDETIAFWCCGARTETGISAESRRRIVTYGVRGPLTRDVLGLPTDTPLGDPGLLAPIVYKPAVRDDHQGRTLCVPHLLDSRSDSDLQRLTGADLILRPGVGRSARAVFDVIDAITSASFVLAGSLHAAIVACAYDVPFGYLDTGFVDIPFKWRDFSALVGIGTSFCDRVADARTIYEQVNQPRLRKPPLLPMLSVAPFSVRLEALLKAYHHDRQHLGGTTAPYSEHLTALLGLCEYSILEPDRKPAETQPDPVDPMRSFVADEGPDELPKPGDEPLPERQIAPAAAETAMDEPKPMLELPDRQPETGDAVPQRQTEADQSAQREISGTSAQAPVMEAAAAQKEDAVAT